MPPARTSAPLGPVARAAPPVAPLTVVGVALTLVAVAVSGRAARS